MRKLRADSEYHQKESESNEKRIREYRTDSEFRRRENECNDERMKKLRADSEYHQKESESNEKRIRKYRTDSEFRRKENESNENRMKESRDDPAYHQRENECNVERMKELRADSEYHRKETESNTKRMRVTRANPGHRLVENECNKKRIKEIRSDPEYRRKETESNAENMRKKRKTDDKFSQHEKENNRKRMRTTRSDPEYAEAEREANSQRMKDLRDNESYVATERITNTRAKRLLRSNEILRQREVVRNIYTKDKKDPKHSAVVLKFLDSRKDLPNNICSCCENMFMPAGMKKRTTKKNVISVMSNKWKGKDPFKPKIVEEKVINFFRSPEEIFFCHTCSKYINQGRIPKMSSANGFKSEVPMCIKILNPMERRIVAPVVVFQSIFPLARNTTNPQVGIKGNAIHIPVDVEEMITSLPRRPDQLEVISVPVEFKRCKEHKSNYLTGIVRPSCINAAAEYLKDTPLYKDYGITFTFMDEHESDDDMNTSSIIPEHAGSPHEQIDMDSDSEFYEQLNDDGDEECLLVDLDELAARNTTLILAPGQGKMPVSALQNPDYEYQAFPEIFGGHRRILTDKNISKSNAIKWEVRSRFGISVERLLYCTMQKLKIFCENSVRTVFRKKIVEKGITASAALDSNGLKDFDGGMKCLETIPVSPPYFSKIKKIMFAHIAQLGPPTFFVTISIDEINCVELIQGLVEFTTGETITEMEALNLPLQERTKLVNGNPVFTAMYVDNLFKRMLALMNNPDGIFSPYPMEDYFRRREYQKRGPAHDHTLCKLRNAPVYDPENPETFAEVCKFVDRFITCAYDPENPNTKYLRHKHTHTCSKGKKNKEICRFNFPQFMMPETMILQPLPPQEKTPKVKENLQKIKNLMEVFYKSKDRVDKPFNDVLQDLEMTLEEYKTAIRCSIVRPKIFYRRRSCDIDINSYNLEMLNLMGSNVDMQFILDPYAVAKYCVDYVLKPEAGIAKALKDTETELSKGNFSFREKYRKLANKFLNCIMMPQCQAAYYALGTPMTKFKLASIFINTGPKEQRVVFLKSAKQLEELPPDSTDIFGKDIHTHYANRRGMADICLAEYAAYYFRTANKRRPDKNLESDAEQDDDDDDERINDGRIKRRVNPRILRFIRYNREKDPMNYFREQLLLFLPWRNEDEEIEPVDWELTVEQTYIKHEVIIDRNRAKLLNMPLDVLEKAFDEAEENRRLLDEEEVAEFEADPIPKEQEIDLFVDMGIDRPKSNVPFTYSAPPTMDKAELNEMLKQLNAGQKEIVMHVYKCFTTNKVDENPLRIFVAGSAGVGKSMVIKTIFQLITYHLNYVEPKERRFPDALRVVLCAFSGKAAFLIGGNTLHSAFSLPLQENANMDDLSMEVGDNLRKQMWQCRLLIIDEISMVGSKTFIRINTRCKQIFGRTESFGGLSVILFGDMNQIPPVKDTLIFTLPRESEKRSSLWKEFSLFELTEVMRQRDDLKFVQALNNFADAKMTSDDVTLIKSREVFEHQVPDEAFRLYYRNADVEKYNDMKIAASCEELIECQAIDKFLSTKGKGMLSGDQLRRKQEMWKNRKTKDCGGYPFSLSLKRGIKYMVTANISVSDGLVNGASGVLKDVYCDPKTGIPKIVFIDFGCSRVGRDTRSQYRAQFEKLGLSTVWTPIERRVYQLTTQYQDMDHTATRNQFPLVPSEALTIHKSQGQTYPQVCLTFIPSVGMSRQLVYVGMSRVTKLEGLYIVGNFRENIQSNNTLNLCKDEMDRMRRECQLPLAYDNLKNVQGLVVAYLNIQSLRNKLGDIDADSWYSRCDILVLSETWTKPNEMIKIKNFELKYRSDEKFAQQGQGNYQGKGLMCFIKSTLCVEIGQKIQCVESKCHVDLVEIIVNGISIISGYRSPKFNYGKFERILSQFSNIGTAPTIIIGDFNINLNSKENSPTKRAFESWMLTYNMQNQLMRDEVTHNGGSQLDVIFSNIHALNAGVYECYFSDHKPIYAIVNGGKQEAYPIPYNHLDEKNPIDLEKIEEAEFEHIFEHERNTSIERRISDKIIVFSCPSEDDADSERAPRCDNCNYCDSRLDGLLLSDSDSGETANIPSEWYDGLPEIINEDELVDGLLVELSACLGDLNDNNIQNQLKHVELLYAHLEVTRNNVINDNVVRELQLGFDDFEEKQITGDGNCQFNSISYSLTNNESHQKLLRVLAFESIWNERNFFQYLFDTGLMESGSLNELLRICCTDGEWGNTDTLIALSINLRRCLYIYCSSRGGRMLLKIKPHTIGSNVPIVLHLGNVNTNFAHYNVMLPRIRNVPFSLENPQQTYDIAELYERFRGEA